MPLSFPAREVKRKDELSLSRVLLCRRGGSGADVGQQEQEHSSKGLVSFGSAKGEAGLYKAESPEEQEQTKTRPESILVKGRNEVRAESQLAGP